MYLSYQTKNDNHNGYDVSDYSHHVNGGKKSRGTHDDLGSTFNGIWVVALERISALISSGTILGTLGAKSGWVSGSWDEESTACTGHAFNISIIISTWDTVLSGNRSEECKGSEFHLVSFN
tara:strand:+ start:150 stop:512 length:363 start_codon:yes stop_codon:yes gene_type:complete